MMSEHDQPILAQILADLRGLKRENVQLREKVAALEARRSAPPVHVPPAPRLDRPTRRQGSFAGRQAEARTQPEEARRPSRRGVLRAVMGAAAAAAGAGALVEAGTGTALADNYGNFSTTTTSTPAVAVSATGSGT